MGGDLPHPGCAIASLPPRIRLWPVVLSQLSEKGANVKNTKLVEQEKLVLLDYR